MMQRRWWVVALWLLFAFLYIVPLRERDVYFGGDQADLLKAADATLRGHPPLAGAASRENVSHPGPLFTYLLAAIQALTLKHEAVTIAVVLALHALTVPLLALLAYQLTGHAALSALLPFLFVLNVNFVLTARFLWNVSIVTPALALAFLLAVLLEERRAWMLPALAATLTLVAQAHMGFLPLAAWIGAVALVRALLARPRSASAFTVSAVVLALLWAPVLLDAVLHRGGNPARLAARFAAPHPPHPMAEVRSAFETLLAETLGGGAWRHRGLILGAFALIAIATVRGPRASAMRWLLALALGCWAVLVLSVRTIPEPIQTYYLRPIVVLFAVTLIGGAAALLALLPVRPARVLGWVAAAGLAAVSVTPAREVWRAFADGGWNTYPLSEVREATALITGALGPERRAAAVEFKLGDLAGVEPSVLYLLARAGVERVHREDVPRFRLTELAAPPGPEGRAWTAVGRAGRYRVERLGAGGGS